MVTGIFTEAMLEHSNPKVGISKATLEKLVLLTQTNMDSTDTDAMFIERTIQLLKDWSSPDDNLKLTWAKELFNAKYKAHTDRRIPVTQAYGAAHMLVNSENCTLRDVSDEVREINDLVGRLRKTAESNGYPNTVEYLQSLISVPQSAEA